MLRKKKENLFGERVNFDFSTAEKQRYKKLFLDKSCGSTCKSNGPNGIVTTGRSLQL